MRVAYGDAADSRVRWVVKLVEAAGGKCLFDGIPGLVWRGLTVARPAGESYVLVYFDAAALDAEGFWSGDSKNYCVAAVVEDGDGPESSLEAFAAAAAELKRRVEADRA